MPAKSRFGAGSQHSLCNFVLVLLLACALAGMKISAAGIPLRFELAGAFGNLSGNTNQLDPVGLDETVDSRFVWIASARAGVERTLGTATVFVTGGVAVSRIANSVVDIDFGPDMPTQEDPDDSFRDRSTEVGWVIGAGIEVPLPDSWALRLEGSHLDFGRETHRVNHSGGGRCGPGGVRKPCPTPSRTSFASCVWESPAASAANAHRSEGILPWRPEPGERGHPALGTKSHAPCAMHVHANTCCSGGRILASGVYRIKKDSFAEHPATTSATRHVTTLKSCLRMHLSLPQT